MKQGKSLTELAIELDRRNKARRDYVVNTASMKVFSDPEKSRLTATVPGYTEVSGELKDLAMEQLCTRVGIPGSYRKKLITEPELLDTNINYWLEKQRKPAMIRTLDNKVDAVLSNSYKRIDNYPVAEMVLPVLQEADVKIESCEVTDRKMYIKCVSPRLEGEVKVGDPVQMGLIISNSEVGLGFMNVQALIYRLVCLNGMVRGRDFGDGIRLAHRGSRQGYGIVYGEDTLRAYGQAISLQVRDTVRELLMPETFQRHLEAMKETTERRITGDPTLAIEQLGKAVGFSQEEGKGIMRHLIEGGDLSQWGLANAVTRYAQEPDLSYDRASELEVIGGKVIDLPARTLKPILEAA